jgi:hypothetical protein
VRQRTGCSGRDDDLLQDRVATVRRLGCQYR